MHNNENFSEGTTQLLVLFLILTAAFQVNCTAVLLGDSNCVNITCEEAEGSQNIVGVEVFLNGESQGPGKHIYRYTIACVNSMEKLLSQSPLCPSQKYNNTS